MLFFTVKTQIHIKIEKDSSLEILINKVLGTYCSNFLVSLVPLNPICIYTILNTIVYFLNSHITSHKFHLFILGGNITNAIANTTTDPTRWRRAALVAHIFFSLPQGSNTNYPTGNFLRLSVIYYKPYYN